jgi:hypothetical protein
MRPIEYRQFEDMLRGSKRAWHLELRDTYNVEYEQAHFERWLRGEPDDYAWMNDWLGFIRELSMTGVQVERLRIVTEPHTDYTRWSMAVTELNVSAGENVRYLPRAQTADIDFPEEDCWLLNEDRLILSLFQPDGGAGGFAVETEPGMVARYRAVQQKAWPRGIAYDEYVSR